MTGDKSPDRREKSADDVQKWAETICARLREIDVELLTAA
jgi:hypothetical protein